MALNVFELFGKIVVDHSGAEKGIDKTVKHAKDAESNLSKTFKRIGGMVAAAFSVRAVVDFGKQCTQAYASIAAEESAFAQIMGDYADTAQAKLNAVADQTGVASTRMTGAMTSLTAKFKGLGYDVADATTLATDGLLIATDAAAFWDMSLDESMSHLNSFINGSYEGGEAIGLFANDTQMAAFAIEQGIVKDAKAWAKLDEAQRQATRLLYAKQMMEQSGATGQAAKEADAYANVMANLKEHWRQFQGIIGKPILEKIVLPAMQKLNAFMPKLNEAVQNGIVWLEEGFGKIKGYFEEVFTEDGINLDALPDALSKMFRDLGRNVGGLLNSFGQKMKNGWNNTVWPMTQKFFKATFGIDVPEWLEIKSIVTDWWDGGNGIAAAIASVCNWTLNLFGAPANVTQEDVSNVLSTWWTNTKTFVQKACGWTLALFKQPLPVTLAKAKTTLSTWWTSAKMSVQKACDWTLDLFGAPEGTTEEKVQAVLSSWWSGVTGWVASACNWTLNLFGAPANVTQEDVSNVLSTWWTNTKAFVQTACAWTLGLFNPPEDGEGDNSAVGIITTWWNGIKAGIEEVCQIDLSKVNISGIFTAAKDAYDSFIGTCEDFVNDVLKAVSSNENGEIVLNKRLSGLFDAGVYAVKNILTIASTLVANVVAAITGNEEDAKKIGGVFSDLFGVASEVVIGIKDDAVAIFDWFATHGDLAGAGIAAVAVALGKFALANPAILGIEALVALIGALTIDWQNFESNYPHLVQMFEDLTGLDFTNVAGSLTGIQTALGGLIDWFKQNEAYIYMLVTALGAVAFATGHHVVGGAMVAYGVGELWNDGRIQKYNEDLEETDVPAVVQDPFVSNPDNNFNFPAIWQGLIDLFGSKETEDVSIPSVSPTSTGGNAGNGNLIGTLLQQLSNLKADVATATQEGVAAGLSGVTITGYVTTGDVRLNEGTLVGTLAPKLNLELGWIGNRRG